MELRLGSHLNTPEEMDDLDRFLTSLEAEEAGLLAARTQAAATSWQLLSSSRYLPEVPLRSSPLFTCPFSASLVCFSRAL